MKGSSHTTPLWILLARTAPAYFAAPPPRPPPPTPLTPNFLSWVHLKDGLAQGPARAPAFIHYARSRGAREMPASAPGYGVGGVHPHPGPPRRCLLPSSPTPAPK